MSKNKILLKISGSIAAYKAAYLTSKLVQSNYDVKVVMSNSAKKFVGTATFEGLTGHKVLVDSFEKGETMSHINLVKWADITVVVPATANTINKFACGEGSSLLTTLFLAHDWEKPYLIAPAMNTKMYNHPATQKAMKTLKEWGVKILDTDNGHLACGDSGAGKLIDPDIIFNEIEKSLTPTKKNLSVLITSGGTKEHIDGVRFIANMSTGNTGAVIADVLISSGINVTFLHAENSKTPSGKCKKETFFSFKELDEKLKKSLVENNYNAVIHLAAVSDYSPHKVIVDNKEYDLPYEKKLSSDFDEVKLVMKRNFKIIERIKNYSQNKNLLLVAFKLLKGGKKEEINKHVNSLVNASHADVVVVNNFEDRKNSVQSMFKIFTTTEKYILADTAKNLGEKLSEIITNKNGEENALNN